MQQPIPHPIPDDYGPDNIEEHHRAVNRGEPLSTRARAQIQVAEFQKLLDRAELTERHARDPVSRRRAGRRVRELEAAIREVWPQAYPCVEGDGPPPGLDHTTCVRCGVEISRRQRFDGAGNCGRCLAAFSGRSTTDQERKP